MKFWTKIKNILSLSVATESNQTCLPILGLCGGRQGGLNGLNALRLVPRLRLNGRPSKWYFCFAPHHNINVECFNMP
jgi:hypothetical protein